MFKQAEPSVLDVSCQKGRISCSTTTLKFPQDQLTYPHSNREIRYFLPTDLIKALPGSLSSSAPILSGPKYSSRTRWCARTRSNGWNIAPIEA